MSELNPNHPTTRAISDHWHKIAALLLTKLGGSTVITPDDIAALSGGAITVQELRDGIHLNIVSMEEGERLAAKQGGLPS